MLRRGRRRDAIATPGSRVLPQLRRAGNHPVLTGISGWIDSAAPGRHAAERPFAP
jgi:hypothetical protein